jgi:lipopolysaccharide/colanic/teichoic acid biosynthesis glycosyltransferase
MKRLFDIFMSVLGLITFFPIFIIIGLLVKLNDNGPVIFSQTRVGKNGKTFTLYKFRSMSVLKNTQQGVFFPGNITRITTIGKILRKTKLDELPQLINVFLGQMSMVGPRPEVEKWVAIYPNRWEKVLSVKPGITDEASLLFNNEEFILASAEDPEKMYKEIILPKKLDLYELYVRNHSFSGDLALIVRTIIRIILND